MKSYAWFSRVGLSLAAFVAVVGAALLSAPAASAHGAEHQEPHTWYVHVGLETHNHAIQVMTFSPAQLWINAGDTVVWRTSSAEIHTITFTANGAPPPQPFTGSPDQLARTSATVFAPGTFLNSGVLADINPQLGPGAPFYSSYTLRFPTTGAFTYFCWVHPMVGHIEVREAGTPYPHTQQWYNQQTAILRARSIRQGEELKEQALGRATNHWVAVGIGNDMVDVMRFLRAEVTIHVGESVTFDNLSMGPHTVNIGPEVAPPFVAVGNPASYDGSTPLASGFMFNEQTFTITFTKAGTYDFYCALHDYMGMVGVVHVVD